MLTRLNEKCENMLNKQFWPDGIRSCVQAWFLLLYNKHFVNQAVYKFSITPLEYGKVAAQDAYGFQAMDVL